MCFYDTSGDPKGKKASYTCAVSRDGGRAGRAQSTRPPSSRTRRRRAPSYEYGYYQGLVASHGIAHPIWTDTRKLPTLNEEIYTVRLAEAAMPAPAKR